MKGKHTIRLDKDAVRDAMESYVRSAFAASEAQELSKIVLHKSGQITLTMEPKAEPAGVQKPDEYDHQLGGYPART